VSLVDYEYADLIDNQDKVRTLIDKFKSITNWLNCWELFLIKTISSQELQVA